MPDGSVLLDGRGRRKLEYIFVFEEILIPYKINNGRPLSLKPYRRF